LFAATLLLLDSHAPAHGAPAPRSLAAALLLLL